ncbi:branched-chain alpha-keto acid dehydrogenase subunit E2 [Streptomyces solincola]|uniref:Dihydrolipoamide acetyltransferase component of pyruvate dehydrogenase complex n=1 Tax=Streptomyces solincola TaxID=2100817 RepID=A0A2S9PY40_9ACTN|nr:dihydrolipoamide acetyltransferase family protein [Streptomyces solincola]PRH79325.1 branched-chain alpha-keto acid dehydrogenase subunit E2 [Streptomyces solincola]
MAQVLEFKLPDLGEGLTEAEIVRWLVEVGDVVAIDQPVVEVETAKAMVEVPCPYGGVVTARYGAEGEELPVGAPLITVAVGATEPPAGDEGGAPSAPAAVSARAPGAGGGVDAGGGGGAGGAADEGSGNVLVGYGTSGPAARRRRVRRDADATAVPAPVNGHVAPRADASAAASAPPSAGPASAPAAPAAGRMPTGTSAKAAASGAAAEPGVGPGAARASAPAAASGAVVAPGAVPAAGLGSAVAPGTGPVPGAAVSGAAARGADGSVPVVAEGPVAVISPLVRKLARDQGVDLRRVAGSGRDGLILRADVERAVAAARAPVVATAVAEPAAPPVAAPPVVAPTAAGRAGERVPLRGVRGAVAAKLSRSRQEIPDATCWVDADATELLAARTAMNAAGGPKVSLLALLARICTAALARFPELNATVDTEAREIVRLPGVHIGFAAQTERGLVVPVVRDAHGRTAESLTAEFARLTEAARTGTLTPADLTGGTFTLNNYGVFGVDGSTPIINHPEAAMLGVGRIIPKPWVHQGELAVRQVVQLSLTFDHRVCDGGTAGGFLRYVADCVEQPAVLLRTL